MNCQKVVIVQTLQKLIFHHIHAHSHRKWMLTLLIQERPSISTEYVKQDTELDSWTIATET